MALGDWVAAFQDLQSDMVWRIATTVTIIVLAWVFSRIGRGTFERSAKRIAALRKLDKYQTQIAVSNTKPLAMGLKLLLALVVVIALLGIWGLTGAFATLLAGAGFAGIVIGLAAADVIGDILAGFMLLYRGPFHVGDWVEIDGTQGIVQDVGLADTTIVTFDGERISFPNSLVESGKIRNFTIERKLRIKIPVGVEYGSDLQKAKDILVELGTAHPKTLSTPAPAAFVLQFGASSVDLDLRVWIDPVHDSALMTKNNLVQQIHDRFRAEGIGIAFPHVQLVQKGGTA